LEKYYEERIYCREKKSKRGAAIYVNKKLKCEAIYVGDLSIERDTQ